MRISVIMAVNLSPYELIEEGEVVIRSADDPEFKFKRAVNSFINQSFTDAELIIVSDGCRIAETIYKNHYPGLTNIRFKYIEKQVAYGGAVRQAGIDMAGGKIICYLDHDDMFGKDHLNIINTNFNIKKYSWVYYNDWVIYFNEFGQHVIEERDVKQEICMIGTSSIAHRRTTKVVWSDGYGHDWRLIDKYLIPRKNCIKIASSQYYVCHRSNVQGVRGDGELVF